MRTKQDIVEDYVDYLVKIGIVQEHEAKTYKEEKQAEVLELLTEKLYETEVVKGVRVSTLQAFYHYVNFVMRKDPMTGQYIWNDFVKNIFLDIEQNKNTSILASRGLGKSFFLYVLYSSFKMFLYSGTKILMISNIPQQCVENLRILKSFIDGNEMLLEKKDQEKGRDLKWTERQIEYNQGMLLTLSAGTTPKGQHVNYVIVDDILTDTTVYSDDEIENYVLGQLYPCAQRKKGRTIVVGTPLHEQDIYHTLMNTDTECSGQRIDDGRISHLRFFSKAYPVRRNGDESGELMFPEIFSAEDLKEIKVTQGELKFQREYLLKATNTKAVIFPVEITRDAIDKAYEYEEEPTGDNRNEKTYITGVDVATSGSASADFSAFVTLEIYETKHGMKKILRNIYHERGMKISAEYDKEGNILSEDDIGQVEKIHDICKTFNNALTAVEKNNVGVAIIQELQKRNVNVEEFITDKYKKESMIRYLVNEISNKNIIFPNPNEEVKKLLKELNNFGVKRNKRGKETMEALTGHDDLVMALAIANFCAQNTGSLPEAIVQD